MSGHHKYFPVSEELDSYRDLQKLKKKQLHEVAVERHSAFLRRFLQVKELSSSKIPT